MLAFIVSLILAILLAIVLIKWVSHQLSPKNSEISYTVYRIQFKDSSDKVDLKASLQLSDQVTIALEDAFGYVVHSKISDQALKQVIQKEFDLSPSRFIVSSRQFMNF